MGIAWRASITLAFVLAAAGTRATTFVPTGAAVRAVVADPFGRRAFVLTIATPAELLAVDIDSGSVAWRVPLPAAAWSLVADAAVQRVVVGSATPELIVIDTTVGAVSTTIPLNVRNYTGPAPSELAFASGHVYGEVQNKLLDVDLATRRSITRPAPGTLLDSRIAASADGRWLHVGAGIREVLTFDLAGLVPQAVSWSGRAYSANRTRLEGMQAVPGTDDVLVDTCCDDGPLVARADQSMVFVGELPTDGELIAVSPDGTTAWVVDRSPFLAIGTKLIACDIAARTCWESLMGVEAGSAGAVSADSTVLVVQAREGSEQGVLLVRRDELAVNLGGVRWRAVDVDLGEPVSASHCNDFDDGTSWHQSRIDVASATDACEALPAGSLELTVLSWDHSTVSPPLTVNIVPGQWVDAGDRSLRWRENSVYSAEWAVITPSLRPCETRDVVIHGYGFTPVMTVTDPGTDVVLESWTYVSANRLDARVSAAADAPWGKALGIEMQNSRGVPIEVHAYVADDPRVPRITTAPADVENLRVDARPGGMALSWSPVTTDVAGQPFAVTTYGVFRSSTPDFATFTTKALSTIPSLDAPFAEWPGNHYILIGSCNGQGGLTR